jgi:hypothetical protein
MKEWVMMLKIGFLVVIGVIVLAALASGGGGPAVEEPAVDGMASITPILESSYVAVPIRLTPSEALAGMKWYNNDENCIYPRFLLVAQSLQREPDLGDAITIAEDVMGLSDAWSELRLANPIASSAGEMYLILQMPAFIERTGAGLNGGPGFGYIQKAEPGPSAYASSDGENWARLGCRLAVSPIKVALAPGMTTLSERAPQGQESEQQQDGPKYSTALYQAAPNPFNPVTQIEFSIADPCRATLAVYNLRGERVITLLDKHCQPGRYSLNWQGVSDRGERVASGVYFVQLRAEGRRFTKRVCLIK